MNAASHTTFVDRAGVPTPRVAAAPASANRGPLEKAIARAAEMVDRQRTVTPVQASQLVRQILDSLPDWANRSMAAPHVMNLVARCVDGGLCGLAFEWMHVQAASEAGPARLVLDVAGTDCDGVVRFDRVDLGECRGVVRARPSDALRDAGQAHSTQHTAHIQTGVSDEDLEADAWDGLTAADGYDRFGGAGRAAAAKGEVAA